MIIPRVGEEDITMPDLQQQQLTDKMRELLAERFPPGSLDPRAGDKGGVKYCTVNLLYKVKVPSHCRMSSRERENVSKTPFRLKKASSTSTLLSTPPPLFVSLPADFSAIGYQ